eukprot:CAMPEP_0168196150 /NCGR_PEP_ID=MMETSP0139_2-20121125/20329_1 /TAXON_ID=44445 /ORGANISM="Pseudo-nitzschia australis, Strain 10249 10 AB" /LENGTH=140 /DNA_ID=CAMNT_0008120239 /DNA_START=1477 /DNA_END=1899 /DNA_ORIENTATION=-
MLDILRAGGLDDFLQTPTLIPFETVFSHTDEIFCKTRQGFHDGPEGRFQTLDQKSVAPRSAGRLFIPRPRMRHLDPDSDAQYGAATTTTCFDSNGSFCQIGSDISFGIPAVPRIIDADNAIRYGRINPGDQQRYYSRLQS